ncbi:hypothetical protein KKH3_34340 [Pectobacterium actinidiae]|nr:hypothetical protein KKH3_34340 [Pectobacterium actinidiae]
MFMLITLPFLFRQSVIAMMITVAALITFSQMAWLSSLINAICHIVVVIYR